METLWRGLEPIQWLFDSAYVLTLPISPAAGFLTPVF